jgi:DNA-directed RNA polymerase specialized sigma24 family protein
LTSPKPLKLEKKSRDHETILLNHYDWLLDWAIQLTQGASDEAEDLVQDLYVRFVQMKSGPSFTDDDQIRAYLYTSLKNLFISKKLRHGRDAISGLLAVDFDSVEFVMSAVDRSQLLHVRSDLAGICEYACIRRSTSRAAAALILRFFLGYLPTEVMALFRAKRSNIDTLIDTARLEAKTYLNRPGTLRFLSRSARKSPSFPRYLPEQSEALFAELQRRIFSEPEGTCLPPDELRDRYLLPDAPPFTTPEITHLVSCRTCLNQASRLLGLPDLTLRFFHEGDMPESQNPPSARTGEEGLKKLRRRLRETYEHRPKKLQIVVDGEVKGVQTITGPSSKLQLKLAPLSKPGFVEVLSEQGLGLLYLDLQQEMLDVPAPTTAAVDLSDGRYLSVTLTLVGGAPVVDLNYYDPLLEVSADDPPLAPADVATSLERGGGRTEQISQEQPRENGGWRTLRVSMLKLRGPWNIGLAIGFTILIAFGIGYPHHSGRSPKEVTAAEILAQSLQQRARTIPPHGATRGTYSLEVLSSEGQTIGIEEVDSLRSADSPLQAIYLRAQNGGLLASHSVDAGDKVRDFSTSGKSSRQAKTPKTELEDKVWQHSPDPVDFERLAADQSSLRLRRLQDAYEVSFTRSVPEAQSGVVEGHLVIAVATMRPIAETLVVHGNEDTREYRFKEIRYEVLSPEQIQTSDFLPAVEMFHPSRRNRRTEAWIPLLYALQVLDGQPQMIQAAVDIERRPDGEIEIAGVLPSHQRLQELAQSFRALPGGDSLKLDLHSVDEPPSSSHRVSVVQAGASLTVEDKQVPLDAMLRSGLAADHYLSEAQMNDRVQEKAREIIVRSNHVRRAAWSISQIGARDFHQNELAAMSTQDRQTWLALLARPLLACDAELTSIATALGGGETGSISPPSDLAPSISTVQELSTSSEVLRQSADHLDRLLMAAFALSPDALSASVSPAELLAQLAEVQHEERRLGATVHLLQHAAAISRTE